MRQPHPPVSKVRKGHDSIVANAQHLSQNFQRVPGFLQRLAEDDVLECLGGIVGQAFVDIALINGHAARDGPLHQRSVDLHAAGIHALVNREPFQQFAIAAAEVQHLGVGLHDFADDGVVAAAQQLAQPRLRRRFRGRRH